MPQQINLYNPAFEAQRSLTTFKGALVGWAVAVALVAAVAAYELFSLHATQQRESDLLQRLGAAQTEAQRLGSQIAARKGDVRLAEEIVRRFRRTANSRKLPTSSWKPRGARRFCRYSTPARWVIRTDSPIICGLSRANRSKASGSRV